MPDTEAASTPIHKIIHVIGPRPIDSDPVGLDTDVAYES